MSASSAPVPDRDASTRLPEASSGFPLVREAWEAITLDSLAPELSAAQVGEFLETLASAKTALDESITRHRRAMGEVGGDLLDESLDYYLGERLGLESYALEVAAELIRNDQFGMAERVDSIFEFTSDEIQRSPNAELFNGSGFAPKIADVNDHRLLQRRISESAELSRITPEDAEALRVFSFDPGRHGSEFTSPTAALETLLTNLEQVQELRNAGKIDQVHADRLREVEDIRTQENALGIVEGESRFIDFLCESALALGLIEEQEYQRVMATESLLVRGGFRISYEQRVLKLLHADRRLMTVLGRPTAE